MVSLTIPCSKSLQSFELENSSEIFKNKHPKKVNDFSIFLSAVIDEKSFDRISGYIESAKQDPNCTIIAGGNCDKSKARINYTKTSLKW